VRVVFLPPNTTCLCQPMDQAVNRSFKAIYLRKVMSLAVWALNEEQKTLDQFWREFHLRRAIKVINEAWREVKKSTMVNSWRKLIPGINEILEPDFVPDLPTQSNSQIDEHFRFLTELDRDICL